MYNKKRKNNIIIGGLLAVVLIMGIGYAAFASKLNINGTGSVSGNWNIRITNMECTEKSDGASNIEEPTWEDLTGTFSIGLTKPGDWMTYEIEVTNGGNIDAVLDKIDVNVGDNPIMIYEVTDIEKGDFLVANTSIKFYLNVKYDSSITSMPDNVTSTITITLDYVQSDTSGGSTDGDGGSSSSAMLAKLNETVIHTSNCTYSSATSEDDETNESLCQSGLYADTVTRGRYYYRGKNPNNYITFNNETWRILSIESNGTLKIIRYEALEDELKFDAAGNRSSSTSTYCTNASSDGCNAWAATSNLVGTPSSFTQYSPNGNTSDSTTYSGTVTNDSTMATYLNGTYYNSLSSDAKSKVVQGTFNVSTPGGESDTETLETDAKQEKQYQWKGYVGLPTITEVLRASTRPQCNALDLGFPLAYYCNNNNWLNGSGMTISPIVDEGNTKIWTMSSMAETWRGSDYIRPVLHISSNITLSGTGTQSDPYVIVL